VSFTSAVFIVIISRFRKENIGVTVKEPKKEEIKMDWKRLLMIIILRKCDLQINGPGQLVRVIILFYDLVQQKATVTFEVN
jgi:hypothetical protein